MQLRVSLKVGTVPQLESGQTFKQHVLTECMGSCNQETQLTKCIIRLYLAEWRALKSRGALSIAEIPLKPKLKVPSWQDLNKEFYSIPGGSVASSFAGAGVGATLAVAVDTCHSALVSCAWSSSTCTSNYAAAVRMYLKAGDAMCVLYLLQ